MKELLEAGVHFGHQTKRWNPKMQKYIFGERNGIYIIDLQKTLKKFREAYAFMRDLAAQGGTVLFVGTKKQAQEAVLEEAARCGMFYVNHRWLGGTLTNFATIRKSIARLKKLDEMKETGEYSGCQKEVLGLEREREKLEKALVGIKNLDRLPSAVFIVDPKKEDIAVEEARAARHPHRRHRGHQLRPHRDRLSTSRQRRRHPGGAPHHRRAWRTPSTRVEARSPRKRRRRSRPRRTCPWSRRPR